jgi:hypothetical protein
MEKQHRVSRGDGLGAALNEQDFPLYCPTDRAPTGIGMISYRPLAPKLIKTIVTLTALEIFWKTSNQALDRPIPQIFW